MLTDQRAGPAEPKLSRFDDAFQAIGQAISQLQYGAILITVHDGRPVQMDITEKRRFA